MYTFKFIKHFWECLKSDVLQVMHEFHSFGRLPRGSNTSFLALIPKDSTKELRNYRPISLIGFLYKILSKRSVMHKVVEETQLTFTSGRNMLDNVVIVKETNLDF